MSQNICESVSFFKVSHTILESCCLSFGLNQTIYAEHFFLKLVGVVTALLLYLSSAWDPSFDREHPRQ